MNCNVYFLNINQFQHLTLSGLQPYQLKNLNDQKLALVIKNQSKNICTFGSIILTGLPKVYGSIFSIKQNLRLKVVLINTTTLIRYCKTTLNVI